MLKRNNFLGIIAIILLSCFMMQLSPAIINAAPSRPTGQGIPKNVADQKAKPAAYTVTFQDWDGTVLSTQTVKSGASATAPTDPSRDGYDFTGWSTSFRKVSGNLTVTAQYAPVAEAEAEPEPEPEIETVIYTVTFVDWDGTALSTQAVESGAAANAPADPSRDGYTFTGWSASFNNITEDLTVTAQYTAIPIITTYTVTFEDWNGTVLSTQTVESGSAATAPGDPSRDGYTFTGWSTSFDNITADLTVTAQYTINQVNTKEADMQKIANAKEILAASGTLNPKEALDTNVVPMVQSIVDGISPDVKVAILSSGNAQIAADGTITYGSKAVTGNVTFTLTSNEVSDNMTLTVAVPQTAVIIPSIAPKYADTFDSGSIASFWNREHLKTAYSMNVTSSPTNSSSKALRVELRKTDGAVSSSTRSELALNEEKPLEEHWYSFSTYLPEGGSEDYALDANSTEIIAQWHNYPDPNEEWTSPPLALCTRNGGYFIRRYWDDAAITTTDQMKAKGYTSKHDLGSYEADKGRWVDWTFHVKWGWLASQEPILEVYKDGVKVLDCTGLPNTTNDQIGNYMKIGVYKWDWSENPQYSTVDTRIVYYDNVNVQ